MANAFSKEEIVFFEQVLEGFNPNNITARQVNKYQPPATQFERAALTVHRPVPYISVNKEGLVLVGADFADITQLSVPSTLNANDSAPSDIRNVPFTMNAVELNDPQQRDRKATSAVQALGALVDRTIATKVGKEGTLFVKDTVAGGITTYGQVSKAELIGTKRDVPIMNARTLIMNAEDYNDVAKDIADAGPKVLDKSALTAFERSKIPMIATFDSFKANFMPTIVAAAGTGWLVNGVQKHVPLATDANGNNVDNRTMNLVVDTGAGTVKLGDAFTIAGVNSLSMINKEDTGDLQTFRVIARVDATNWTISPAIVTGSATKAEEEYANCSAAAPDNAAITFLNTDTRQANIFFENNAVEIIHGSLSTMELDGSSGVVAMKEATDSGIEILFAKGSDIKNLGTEYRLTMWMNANILNEQMCGCLLGKQVT
ncbi:MAG: P22 phage major capsid protein family protein [Gammaproteobacteria bacterium]